MSKKLLVVLFVFLCGFVGAQAQSAIAAEKTFDLSLRLKKGQIYPLAISFTEAQTITIPEYNQSMEGSREIKLNFINKVKKIEKDSFVMETFIKEFLLDESFFSKVDEDPAVIDDLNKNRLTFCKGLSSQLAKSKFTVVYSKYRTIEKIEGFEKAYGKASSAFLKKNTTKAAQLFIKTIAGLFSVDEMKINMEVEYLLSQEEKTHFAESWLDVIPDDGMGEINALSVVTDLQDGSLGIDVNTSVARSLEATGKNSLVIDNLWIYAIIDKNTGWLNSYKKVFDFSVSNVTNIDGTDVAFNGKLVTVRQTYPETKALHVQRSIPGKEIEITDESILEGTVEQIIVPQSEIDESAMRDADSLLELQ